MRAGSIIREEPETVHARRRRSAHRVAVLHHSERCERRRRRLRSGRLGRHERGGANGMEQARGLKVVLFCGGLGTPPAGVLGDDPEADGHDRLRGRSSGTSCATTRTSGTRSSSSASATRPTSSRSTSSRYSEAAIQRLRPVRRRQDDRAARLGHRRTGGSRSSTPASRPTSASGSGPSSSTSATTRSSSPTTATS